MALEPLTAAGVAQKQADLYALSDPALSGEANSIRTNFIFWLSNNFIMNQLQIAYVNSMSPLWLNYAASETAMAVENRLPVGFVAPTPLPPPSISKMVKFESSVVIQYSQVTGFAAAGRIDITLTY
ncbi:MAG: hypothetical protein WC716_11840 [Chitinophagaceae bacterium]|jgi:hypothetical protein